MDKPNQFIYEHFTEYTVSEKDCTLFLIYFFEKGTIFFGHPVLYGRRKITSCGCEWMNFSAVSGCPLTNIFPNEYFCPLIHFYWLLSFLFYISFFCISYLYTALSQKMMMMKARNVHCPFQRVLKPQLHTPFPFSLSKVMVTNVGAAYDFLHLLVCVSCTQRT